jgi:hypothetical protein
MPQSGSAVQQLWQRYQQLKAENKRLQLNEALATPSEFQM